VRVCLSFLHGRHQVGASEGPIGSKAEDVRPREGRPRDVNAGRCRPPVLSVGQRCVLERRDRLQTPDTASSGSSTSVDIRRTLCDGRLSGIGPLRRVSESTLGIPPSMSRLQFPGQGQASTPAKPNMCPWETEQTDVSGRRRSQALIDPRGSKDVRASQDIRPYR
jgi:hypothetical protein